MKVYCVFKEENEAPGDEYLINWTVLHKIFDSEEKAEYWILKQDASTQSFLNIEVFEVE